MKELGTKYYKITDGDLDIVRIIKIIDESNSIILTKDNKKLKASNKDLDEFTLLNPDGYLFFNIVNMGKTENEGQDVIINLNRRSDISKGVNIPFVSCRQNVYDFITNQIEKEEVTHLGLSLSLETTPEDVPYESMLACSSISYTERISIYNDDKLNNILSMISNINKFNSVLYNIYKVMKGSKYVGLCKDLKELLEYNKFMYDFRRAFNILPINDILDENNITIENIINIEDILKHKMNNCQIFRFSKTINLSKIEREYLLVSDKKDNIFIIIYDKGESINRPYINNIKDKSDSVYLIKQIIKK